MKINIVIFLFLLEISFCYYSLQLKRRELKESPINSNSSNNETVKNLTEEQLEKFEEYLDLPLNNSELNSLSEPYINTNNLRSIYYTIDAYISLKKQPFRLLLSTVDTYTTVASINCLYCNVTNKYDPIFLNWTTNTRYIYNTKKLNNQKSNYNMYIDSCTIYSESIQSGIIEKKNITMDYLIFKVFESNSSWILNSNLIDGILSLSYNNDTRIPNNNFITELYNEGKISSPSFSIIITSSNINRLYLGNIMKNEYVKNYVNKSMNKGECQIIDDKWQCRINTIGYTDFKYSGSSRTKSASSMVKFNLKERRLIIPSNFYELLVLGYRYTTNKYGDTYTTEIRYNKYCKKYSGILYCSCYYGKNSFGIVTFYFNNNSRLDLDLREFITYDNSAYIYKCRTDFVLSEKDEFSIGLRGLNNTILSFDMEDKKVEFFHKKKAPKVISSIVWIILSILLVIALNVFAEILKQRFS